MSNDTPAFRWTNASIGGPRATSKLAYGPLCTDDLKKMGLVNGICPAMGSMYCYRVCNQQPPDDCPVVLDSSALAGEDASSPCQACELDCPCKCMEYVVGVDLAKQESRTATHLEWWDGYCAAIKKRS